MNIVWYGQSCFRITTQNHKRGRKPVNIIIDPFKDEVGLKLPKMESDILLLTHDHYDHANRSIAGKDTVTIDSPGEYELRDIFIQGIFSFHDKKEGKERGVNTIYTIETEEVRLCHLGDFGEGELDDKKLMEIGEVDVLMIPVGGVYTIDAQEAAKVISQIEPRIVIPMHYKVPGLKADLDELSSFLKAMGEKQAKAEEKLSLQKKNLPSGEMKVVPLNPQKRAS